MAVFIILRRTDLRSTSFHIFILQVLPDRRKMVIRDHRMGRAMVGLNEGSTIASELAMVVIGGLFTSTFLMLLVIPVLPLTHLIPTGSLPVDQAPQD